ncbi:P-loop NTPase family protein [Anaerococcus provencensis]|uniref:hypothetical protein n=1 Tax=Anaerococcus provencensis TaxID=938293 RepID=UPI000307626A|nr:hypothetical protein [Anaerococcus provencensis]
MISSLRTTRYVKGLLSLSIILMNIFLYIALKSFYSNTYYIDNISDYLPVFNYNIFLLINVIVIFGMILGRCKRNKINNGIRFALTHYKLESKLRKQLIDGKFYFKRDKSNLIILPKIVIEFENLRSLNNAIIRIENSIRFDRKLEELRISAAIPGFKVTQQFMSPDGDFYIYSIVSMDMFNQIEFDTESEYIEWSKEGTDDYSIKLSEYDIIPIHHAGIAAQTGGGKSFLVQSLIIQLKNKEISHDVYVIDPKSADLLSYGKRDLGEGFYSDKSGAIQMIEKFHIEMIKRQDEMQEFFETNRNLDYKDNKMPAKILIIDEFGALRTSWRILEKKERDRIESMLADIVFMGRQLGFFVVLVLQRFASETVPREITEQLVLRIVLGDSDDLTYRTLFSPSVNILKLNLKPGMGYFSYTNIASIDNPSLFVSPYCKFLKGNVTKAQSAEVT